MNWNMPDVTAYPSSVNPPQHKHYQGRHTVETSWVIKYLYINKHSFSLFSPCLSVQNVCFRNPCTKALSKYF